MIDKKDIFKMARHIFRHGNGIRDPKIMHPGREWAIGLVGATISIVVGAVVSTTIFVSYSQDYVSHTDAGEIAIPYKAALVEQAISLYQDKQSVYQTILNQSTSLIILPTIVTEPPVNIEKPKTGSDAQLAN